MRIHLGRCNTYANGKTSDPNKQKRKTTIEGQVVYSLRDPIFDQETCWTQLVKTFVCAELPFYFVEKEEFRKLLIMLQPRFDMPWRYTLRRDIWALYIVKKRRNWKKKSCKIAGKFVWPLTLELQT